MAWSLCTSGAAITKAGSDVNSTIKASGAALAAWSDEVEGYINARTRYDWISNAPSTNYAGALSIAASCLIANHMIAYDLGSYPTTARAQTMMDLNKNMADDIIKDLKDKSTQELM